MNRYDATCKPILFSFKLIEGPGPESLELDFMNHQVRTSTNEKNDFQTLKALTKTQVIYEFINNLASQTNIRQNDP